MKRTREDIEKIESKWKIYELGRNDLLEELIHGKKVRLSTNQNA